MWKALSTKTQIKTDHQKKKSFASPHNNRVSGDLITEKERHQPYYLGNNFLTKRWWNCGISPPFPRRGWCSLLRALSSQREEFVNDKTPLAHRQIPLLTNASKVPCRQVGVNSSPWHGAPPTSGLDNIKESSLPSPETKKSLHSFLQPSEQKQT